MFEVFTVLSLTQLPLEITWFFLGEQRPLARTSWLRQSIPLVPRRWVRKASTLYCSPLPVGGIDVIMQVRLRRSIRGCTLKQPNDLNR